MTVRRRTNFVWALVLLALAGVLLAQALGLITPGVWDVLVRAAPAILVFAGLMLLLRDRAPVGGLIALGLTVLLVAGIGAAAFSQRSSQLRDDNILAIAQAIDDNVTLLRVRLQTFDTDIDVRPGADRASGVSGQFTGSLASAIDVSYEPSADNSATLTITERRSSDLPLLEQVGRGTLALELPPGVPLDIALQGASGEATLSLDGLALERLNGVMQSGDVAVTMPDYAPQLVPNGESNGTIGTQNGALTLFLPAAVAARLELNRSGSGIEPLYDPAIFNYLVGDVLESRSIDRATAVLRYGLTAPRGQIRVESAP